MQIELFIRLVLSYEINNFSHPNSIHRIICFWAKEIRVHR